MTRASVSISRYEASSDYTLGLIQVILTSSMNWDKGISQISGAALPPRRLVMEADDI